MNSSDEALLQAASALSTTAISDALDSLKLPGCLDGIAPQTPNSHCAGLAFTVLFESVTETEGYRGPANYMDEVSPGSIIIVSNAGRTDCSAWGDVLTHAAIARGARGTIIDGAARDIDDIRRLQYPVFSRTFLMRSGKNRVQLKAAQTALTIGDVIIRPGDLVVGDANGCIAVPRERAEQIVSLAQTVEATEQRIMNALNNGVSLEDARRQYRYDKPWLGQPANS